MSDFVFTSNRTKRRCLKAKADNYVIYCALMAQLQNLICLLGHSMSTHIPILPTISDFAEIWHVCRFA